MRREHDHWDRIGQRLRERGLVWSGLLLMSGLAFIASATWGFAEGDDLPPAEGLRGVLPFEVPSDLSEESFAILGGNWAEWSESVARDVARLYEDEALDVAGQRALLKTLRSKLNVMQRALADDRYRSIFEELTTMHGRLVRRVDVAEAVFDTLELDPHQFQNDRLVETREAVLQSGSELEESLRSIRNGEPWIGYLRLDAVRETVQPGKSPAAALPAIEQTLARLAARDRLEDEQQRAFLSRPEFANFERALVRYSEAIRPAEQDDAENALREQLALLVEGLEDYEANRTKTSADAVRTAHARVRRLAPDGGRRLDETLRRHYFNYNLLVRASAPFLNRFVADTRTDAGPVRDYILGADVYGQQVTNTNVELILKPSPTDAVVDLALSGVTQSNTQGITHQATVYTNGYHQFWAAKEVRFNGEKFITQPARISVSANNRTAGAETHVSHVPLFGRFADRVAVREAERRRPESEAIARSRVSDRVLPPFNQEVDSNLARANDNLQSGMLRRLRDMDLDASARRASSTSTHVRLDSRLMGGGELGGGTLLAPRLPTDGVMVHVHESLLNNSVDRIGFAGQTMNEDEIRAQLEDFLTRLLDREIRFEPADNPAPASEEGDNPEGDDEADDDDGPATFAFDETDPIRFSIDRGNLFLSIRTGLIQPDREDIPPQEVTVPLTLRIDGDQILIERGTVRVSPLQRPANVARQIAQAGVIRRRIESALPERRVNRTFNIRQEGRPDVVVKAVDIQAVGGWLSIEAR